MRQQQRSQRLAACRVGCRTRCLLCALGSPATPVRLPCTLAIGPQGAERLSRAPRASHRQLSPPARLRRRHRPGAAQPCPARPAGCAQFKQRWSQLANWRWLHPQQTRAHNPANAWSQEACKAPPSGVAGAVPQTVVSWLCCNLASNRSMPPLASQCKAFVYWGVYAREQNKCVCSVPGKIESTTRLQRGAVSTVAKRGKKEGRVCMLHSGSVAGRGAGRGSTPRRAAAEQGQVSWLRCAAGRSRIQQAGDRECRAVQLGFNSWGRHGDALGAPQAAVLVRSKPARRQLAATPLRPLTRPRPHAAGAQSILAGGGAGDRSGGMRRAGHGIGSGGDPPRDRGKAACMQGGRAPARGTAAGTQGEQDRTKACSVWKRTRDLIRYRPNDGLAGRGTRQAGDEALPQRRDACGGRAGAQGDGRGEGRGQARAAALQRQRPEPRHRARCHSSGGSAAARVQASSSRAKAHPRSWRW